jgi:hypothetical protein
MKFGLASSSASALLKDSLMLASVLGHSTSGPVHGNPGRNGFLSGVVRRLRKAKIGSNTAAASEVSRRMDRNIPPPRGSLQ